MLMKKIAVPALLISVLAVAVFSGRDTVEYTGVDMETAYAPETTLVGNSGSLTKSADDLIKITKDDRSMPLKKYSGSDGTFRYYYEEAYLPDTVKNHEKINADIKANKEKFFAANEIDDDMEESLGFVKEGDAQCFSSVKSVYLDENYYSLCVERYIWLGGTDFSDLTGYTYDLKTGERVGLDKVLNKKGKELKSLLHGKVNRYFDDTVGVTENPEDETFPNDGYTGEYNYCIACDGRVYLLYDKNQISAGYMGSMACYTDKYAGRNKVVYSEMKKPEGGKWYTLTAAELKKARESVNINDPEGDITAADMTPYIRDGKWYVPIAFERFDNTIYETEIVSMAEVPVDEPSKVTSTSDEMYDDVFGTWYTMSQCEDERTGESVPATCCIISRYNIDYYDYVPAESCYKKSCSKSICDMKRTYQGYIIEADGDADDGSDMISYKTNDEDPYMLSYFGSWISESNSTDYLNGYSGSSSLISQKSADFVKYYETDRDFLLYPAKDCVSSSIAVPKINDDPVLLPGPDSVELHFTWEPVNGADGYEVWREVENYLKAGDYIEPRLDDVTDHYYCTGGQDDFTFRIMARAYKLEKGRKIYSEWSQYATGSTGIPLSGSEMLKGLGDVPSKPGDDYYEKAYSPVLKEYKKVFENDQKVYGLRAPDDLYYKLNGSFDSFDTDDFYYAFIDLDDSEYDDGCDELVIMKRDRGDDLVYAVYHASGYPWPVRSNFVAGDYADPENPDYFDFDLACQKGEDIILYDNGIIAKVSDKNGVSTRSYFKLDMHIGVEPNWFLEKTLISTTDGKGAVRYYSSDLIDSMRYSLQEKKGLYKEIKEDEYKEIRKKYENPSGAVRKSFKDLK